MASYYQTCFLGHLDDPAMCLDLGLCLRAYVSEADVSAIDRKLSSFDVFGGFTCDALTYMVC